MSYATVLGLFIVTPVLLLLRSGARGLGRFGARGRMALPAIAAVAFVYTAPWDNWLIWTGVWDSPAERVLGRVGYVPVEEYVFFLLQTVLTGLWLGRGLVGRRLPALPRSSEAGSARGSLGAGLAVGVGLVGVALLGADQTTYLGAILAWTAPVLAGMWWLEGPALWAARGHIVRGVVPPTLYLWVVDRIAIGEGTWVVSERFTVGLTPFGLPIEEALFFLVTNVMVVLGILLVILPARAGVEAGGAPVRGRTVSPAVVGMLLVPLLPGCNPPPARGIGVVDGGLAPCSSRRNCVRTGPDGIGPHPVLRSNSVEVWNRVADLVADLPRTRLVSRTDRYVHAEVRSRVFRFVDDLELFWQQDNGTVHIRSASRVGDSDLGVNARRIEDLVAALDAGGLIEGSTE